MFDTDLHTPEGRTAAFAAFRANPYSHFITRLRQQRADQIRELFEQPAAMTYDRFNREIWQIGSRIVLRGQPISDKLFLQAMPSDARVAELSAALDANELVVEGNTIWHPGSGVYGPGLKEDVAAKEAHIRHAFTILTNVKLAPFEKVAQINKIPGFGPGAANMLVMLVAPTAWALNNEQARSALKRCGFPAVNETEVQVSASQLREELGAADFIELDLFLYQLNQSRSSSPHETQVWWVNQGHTYEDSKRRGVVEATLHGEGGRHVPGRAAVARLRPGDIVVHHHQKYIRAVSQVQSAPYLVNETDGTQWNRVETIYHQLDTPLPSSSIAQALLDLEIPNGPIAQNLTPKQSYLHSLSRDGLQVLFDASPTNTWPSYVTDLLENSGSSAGSNGTGALPVPLAPTIAPYEALVAALQHKGLFFPPELLSTYLLALQAKGFVILTGISGTGKTQLALEVAKHFQPTIEQTLAARPPEGAKVLQMQRYMAQGNHMVLPVDVVEELNLSPDGTNDVMIYFPGGETRQRLYKYPRNDTRVLRFRDQLRAWFRNSLQPGDTFFVEVVQTNGDDVAALRFSIPAVAHQSRRLENYKVVAVRPDWTDARGLLGYYNPLTRRYESTPFLRFLLEAQAEAERAVRERRQAHPYFLILDEMNLARVEYYFADFLSSLESSEPLDLHDDPDIEAGIGAETEQLPIPRRVTVPRNLFFTGTVNVDETTSMFSPKVLDRAFTIEFNQVNLHGFGVPSDSTTTDAPFALVSLSSQLRQPGKIGSNEWVIFRDVEQGTFSQLVVALNDLLAHEQRQFGYRVANEIARFMNLAAEQSGATSDALWAAIDLVLLAKALPKLAGTQHELEPLLIQLFLFALHADGNGSPVPVDAILTQWREQNGLIVAVGSNGATATSSPRLPRVAAKLWRMLRRLRQQGFTAFVS
jgi:hypothetical protein